jgi:hypothetical protein
MIPVRIEICNRKSRLYGLCPELLVLCMRGIKKLREIHYLLYSEKGTQEQIYCHFFSI